MQQNYDLHYSFYMDSTTFNHGFADVQQGKRKRDLFTLPVLPLKTTCDGQKRVPTAPTVGAQPYPGHNTANTHIPLKWRDFPIEFFMPILFLPHLHLPKL